MSNARCLASLDLLTQHQLPLGKSGDPLGLHHWHCGTGIWPSRDIVAGRRHVAGLSQSLPTAPPPMARTPARKAAPLDLGALLAVRDGLSAGGSRIRTPSPALRKSSTRNRWFAPLFAGGRRIRTTSSHLRVRLEPPLNLACSCPVRARPLSRWLARTIPIVTRAICLAFRLGRLRASRRLDAMQLFPDRHQNIG